MDRGKRPVFLNLLQIAMPITAIVSIVHRFTGILLFLVTPLLIYLLALSLRDGASYQHALALLDLPWLKALLALALLAFVHHFLAGLRYIFIDGHIGVSRQAARTTAWWLLAVDGVMIVAVMTVCLS